MNDNNDWRIDFYRWMIRCKQERMMMKFVEEIFGKMLVVKTNQMGLNLSLDYYEAAYR
jgi:hypothetical protein